MFLPGGEAAFFPSRSLMSVGFKDRDTIAMTEMVTDVFFSVHIFRTGDLLEPSQVTPSVVSISEATKLKPRRCALVHSNISQEGEVTLDKYALVSIPG